MINKKESWAQDLTNYVVYGSTIYGQSKEICFLILN